MPQRKLTWATAQRIREIHLLEKLGSLNIIRKLNLPVAVSTVDRILSGKTYTTLKHPRSPKLQLVDRRRIKSGIQLGRRPEYYAVMYDCSVQTIRNALKAN